MKRSLLLFILSLAPYNYTAQRSEQSYADCQSAITWKPNGGRFGDNLLSYSKAKWLSYKFNIPLLYLPFKYSDKLMLHEQEIMYTPESAQLFSTITYIPPKKRYQLLPNNNTLYISNWDADITIDWYDQVFVEKLKQLIYPRYQLDKIIIPDECISIAAHVRTGGTFHPDTEQEKERCPLRFVSDEFFIDQIARIANMFQRQNLYVHIFTDHQEPEILKNKFEKALSNPRITFGYRKDDNAHNANVLEDFFSMMDFHCLIRPGSHFSRFVQRLGSNKVVIYPEKARKNADGKSIITMINIKTRNQMSDRWKTKHVTIA